MKRRVRRLAWVGVALTVVALAFGVTERLVWQPGVTEANAARIHEGMTMEEIEAILDVRDERPEGFCGRLVVRPFSGGVRLIWLDDTDRVRREVHRPWSAAQPTLLDRLRSLLGWGAKAVKREGAIW